MRLFLRSIARPCFHPFISLLVVLFVGTAPAHADEPQEVSALIKAGQLDTAAQRADAFLAGKPADVEMRFLKGLILTRQGKSVDAVTLFLKLTQDFPELPEPYNNLAVLYAAQGQYDKARAALEMAIRANPNYAVAYENLGDVYAKLATQAYDKSLQLETNNPSAQGKLALIRDIDSYGNKKPASASAAKK